MYKIIKEVSNLYIIVYSYNKIFINYFLLKNTIFVYEM